MNLRTHPYLAGLLVAGSLAFAVPGVALAQPGAHGGAMQAHQMRGGGMGMLRGLDLTEAQRDQVFKIFHDQAPATSCARRPPRRTSTPRGCASSPTPSARRTPMPPMRGPKP